MENAIQKDVSRVIFELTAMLMPDYQWQAGVLVRLKEAIDRHDLKAAQKLFASGDIWAGSGSVRDVQLADSSLNHRKMELEVELVDIFGRAGISYAGASEIAKIYRSWIADSNVKLRPA